MEIFSFEHEIKNVQNWHLIIIKPQHMASQKQIYHAAYKTTKLDDYRSLLNTADGQFHILGNVMEIISICETCSLASALPLLSETSPLNGQLHHREQRSPVDTTA